MFIIQIPTVLEEESTSTRRVEESLDTKKEKLKSEPAPAPEKGERRMELITMESIQEWLRQIDRKAHENDMVRKKIEMRVCALMLWISLVFHTIVPLIDLNNVKTEHKPQFYINFSLKLKKLKLGNEKT